MATTNYVSLDGMITAEVNNGVMRNYGMDASGSVVETVLNGVAENTYQYKPYGATLAKTGTAVDPKFLNFGEQGYWQTGLGSSEVYSGAAYGSTSNAMWTSGPHPPGKSRTMPVLGNVLVWTCDSLIGTPDHSGPKCSVTYNKATDDFNVLVTDGMRLVSTVTDHIKSAKPPLLHGGQGDMNQWRQINRYKINGSTFSCPPVTLGVMEYDGNPVCFESVPPPPFGGPQTWTIRGADWPGLFAIAGSVGPSQNCSPNSIISIKNFFQGCAKLGGCGVSKAKPVHLLQRGFKL
jgi:hypothetical protein